MPHSSLETDYLVIGGGASAMEFVDTLPDETDHRIVMVDRHDQPGGHWNDAYPFVRLHQPSAYYGVGSRELGRAVKYPSGPNAGAPPRSAENCAATATRPAALIDPSPPSAWRCGGRHDRVEAR